MGTKLTDIVKRSPYEPRKTPVIELTVEYIRKPSPYDAGARRLKYKIVKR